jgi:type II secretion system protein D
MNSRASRNVLPGINGDIQSGKNARRTRLTKESETNRVRTRGMPDVRRVHWAVVCAAGFSSLCAQTARAQDVDANQSSQLSELEVASASTAAPRITFSFSQTPFADVLEFFAREADLPIIYEAGAPGSSMTFLSGSSYTFSEALEILNLNLRMHGVQLTRRDNFLYLSSIADAARRPTLVTDADGVDQLDANQFVTVTMPLNNAVAATVAEQIAPLIKEPGAVTAVSQQNLLVLVETAAQVQRIRELVQRIDSVPPSETDFRVFPLRFSNAGQIASAIRGLVPEYRQIMQLDKNNNPRLVNDVSRPPLRVQPDQRINAVVAVGPTSQMGLIAELIAMLDTTPGAAVDGASADGMPRMMTFALSTITARQANDQLRSLFNALPAQARPTVLALDDANKVTVVGTSGQLIQARALLGEIDPGLDGQPRNASPERVAETIDLQHLDPRRASDLANRLLSPAQRATITYAESPSGSGLVAAGGAEDVAGLRRLLSGLDVPVARATEVRTLRLTANDPQAAVDRALELDALTDAAAVNPVTAELNADGVLTLVGSRDAIERFERRLREVEQSSVVRTTSRSYTIDQASPSAIAEQLRRLADPLLRPSDGSSYTSPVFEAIDDLDRLIVRAEAGQFGLIEDVLDRLVDRAPVDQTVRLIRMNGANPDVLLARATELDTAERAGASPDANGPVTTEFDAESGTLIVRGAERDVARFGASLERAQQLMPPARSTRLIEVRNREAFELIEPLEEFVATADPVDLARRVPDPTIRAVAETNALLITAEDAQHRMIADYVRRLDVIEPTSRPPLKLLQLRTAEAGAIATMLQQQYASRPQTDRIARPVEVRADGQTNTLIVSAHEELLGEIRAFVDELNSDGDEPERITFLFPLRVARATDVANAMDRLYPVPPMPRDRFNRPMPWLQEPKAVTVSADASSNALIIDAPADRRESLEELAQRLDRVELPPVAELRTYQVVNADLNAVANTLRGLARSGGLQGPAQPGRAKVQVVIEAEPRSGTLIVAGDEVTFEKVEQVLESLGTVPMERGLRIVPIANARAEDVRERAVAIYDAQVAQIPGAGGVDVTVDNATNSLEVVADVESMDRFIGVLEQLQSQIGPAREMRLLELRFAQAGEVIGFLRELAVSSESLREGGGPQPVFEPVEATNAILVAAQPGQFAIIEQLVRTLDEPSTAERPPLRILRLRSTDATNLASVLDRSYRARPTDDRAKRPVDIQADAATNTLVVSAHPELLEEIERIVLELNTAPQLDADGREIRIFPLKFARATELASTIDEMFPEPPTPRDRFGRPIPALQGQREVVVRADAATNSLIVDAPAKRMAGFEQIVQSLDQQRPDAQVELRTYRVENADLNAVKATIEDLARRGALGTLGQAPVSVTTEPASRSLIVSGPSGAFDRIDAVLAQVDGSMDRPESSLRLYALEHTRAERLAELLAPMLESRLRESLADSGGLTDMAGELIDVAADAASNTIILSAPPEVHDAAQQLIDALDTEASAAGRTTTRVVPLTYGDAQDVARAINSALPGLDLRGGGMAVVAAAGANALLMTGTTRDLAQVEALVEPLDRRPFDSDELAVETFVLEHARAVDMAERVRSLLATGTAEPSWFLFERIRASRGSYQAPPPIAVTADADRNALVVSGPGSAIETARSIVERLDLPSTRVRAMLTYVPRKADPVSLAASGERLASSAIDEALGSVEFFADPATAGVVVSGDEAAVSTAVAMLSEIDDRTIARPAVELRAFQIQNASAEATASTLSGLLSERSRWPEALRLVARSGTGVPEPTVRASEQGNRVLVSAPASLLPLAESLISTLDQPAGDGATDVRVFRFTRGDVDGAAAAVRSALDAVRIPGERAATVTPEPVSGTLVVAGTSTQLKRAELLVEQLDVVVEPDGLGVRTIFLTRGRAETIAPVLEQALQKPSAMQFLPWWAVGDFVRRNPEMLEAQVKVLPEPRLNALIVSGPEPVLALAEQVVAELEASSENADVARARALQVMTLRNADAGDVAQSIGAMFAEGEADGPAPIVRVDASSNSLIVRATSAQLTEIGELVQTLDLATVSVRRELRTIAVDRSRSSAAEMAQTIQRLLNEQGGLTVEVIDAADLVNQRESPMPDSGDEQGMVAPDVLIPLGSQAEHPLRRAVRVAHVWAVLSTALLVTDAHVADEIDAAMPQDESDANDGPDVTIAIDPATNSLVIMGSPRAAERVATLVARLEEQMPAEATGVRLVTLPQTSDARSLAGLLSQAVRQIGQSSDTNPGGFTGRVSVTGDRVSNSLLVVANQTDFESVSQLIAGLSRADRVESLTLKVYPLQSTDARQAVRTMRDFLSPDPRGLQARRVRALDVVIADADVDAADGEGQSDSDILARIEPGAISVSSNPGGTALIVSAPAEAIRLVDRFVELIDQSPVGDRLAIRRYPLEHAQPGALARNLQGLFDAQRQGPAAGSVARARFVGDDRSQSLFVTASQEQHEEIGRLLQTADLPAAEAGLQLEVIAIKNARPSAVQRVVQQVVIGRDPTRRDRVLVSGQDDTGTLVVRAETDVLEEIREIVASIDTGESATYPVRTISLERADASVVARSLQEFFRNRARLGQQRGRSGAGDAAIVGDRESGTIVISASDDDFEQIASLVSQFDAPSEGREQQFKVIPLEYARANDVASTIQSISWELQFDRGRGRVENANQDQVFVEANNRTNSIVLFGQGDTFGTFEGIIAELDRPLDEQGVKTVAAVSVPGADLGALERIVEQVTATPGHQWWMGPDPGQVQVEADRQRGVLILIGNKEDVERAETYIEQIAAAPQVEGRITRTYELDHADATRAASSLTRFFQDRARSVGSGARARVTVVGSREGNLLIVSGLEEDLDEIGDLLGQIDTPELEEQDRQVEVFVLGNADANEASRTIRAMFPAQRSEDRVVVTPQPSTRSLIVSAPTSVMPEVGSLLERLDRGFGDDPGQRIVTVSLQEARAESLADELRQALPADLEVQITAVARTNSLILTGSGVGIDLVMEQVEALDTAIERSPVEFKRFVLKNALASDAAFSLRQLLRARPRTSGVPSPTVDASFTENIVSVTASPDEMRFIEEMVSELDTPSQMTRRTEFMKLRYARAEQTADALLVFYGRMAPEARTPEDQSVTIVADPASNSLVISAEEAAWPGLTELLGRLDTEEYDTSRQLRVIPLQHADAVGVAQALSSGFRSDVQQRAERERARDASMRGGRDDERTAPAVLVDATDVPSVSAEVQTNSLIVFAVREDLERIETIVAQLDVPESARLPEPRVIPIRAGQPTQLAATALELFASGAGGVAGRQVRIVGDDANSVLVVRATDEQFVQIMMLVARLEAEAVDAMPTANVLILRRTPAARLRSIIQETFGPIAQLRREGLVVGVDRDRNALVITSSDELFDQIERLVTALEGPADAFTQDAGVVIETDDRREGADDAVFQGDDPEVRLEDNEGTGSLRITDQSATGSERVTFLDGMPAGTDATHAESTDRVGEGAARTDADLVNAELVTSDEDQQPGGADWLPRPGVGQRVWVVGVANVSPQEAVAALTALGVTGPQPVDRPGVVSEPVRVVALAARRSVAVVAGPMDGPVVEELIRAIDREPRAGIGVQSVRVVPLELADAGQVIGVLSRMLDPSQQQAGTGAAAGFAEQIRRLSIDGARRFNNDVVAAGGEVDLSTPISLIPHGVSNAIVVASSDANVRAIEHVIGLLDTLPVGDAVVVRIFPMQNASAERVRGIIDDLFRQGATLSRRPGSAREALADSVTGQALAGEIAASVDERTNSLVVAGREEAVALVEVLILSLDTDTSDRGWLETTLIPLTHADPVELQQTIEQALVQGLGDTPDSVGLRRQIGRLRLLAGGGVIEPGTPLNDAVESDLYAPLSDLVVVPEENLPALLVIGTRSNLEIVRELVSMLDIEAAGAGSRVRVVPLENASADRVASVLEEVFEQRERSGRFRDEDRLSIAVDVRTNSIVISTSPRSFEIVESLLDSLDRDASRFAVGLHVVPVAGSDASRLAPRVERLMNERIRASRRAGEPESPEDVFSVEPDPSGELLIVAASDDNLEIVRELVDSLTAGGAVRSEEARTDIVQVQRGNASDIAQTINDVYVDRETERRGDRAVTVRANDRLNALVVSGTAEDIVRVRDLVAQLDEAEISPVRNVRRIELKSANAFEVVQILEDLLRGDGPGRAGAQATRLRFFRDRLAVELGMDPEDTVTEAAIDTALRSQVTLTENLRTNSVLVSAPPPLMVLIEQVIEDLDSTTRGDRNIEIFRLANADAGQLSAVLARLFNLTQQGERLVLVPTGRDDNADPDAITSVTPVPAERQELSVTTDPRTNSILVSATEDYMILVSEVISKLDEVRANERESLVYRLRNAQADAVADTLRSYFEGEATRVQSTLGAQSGSLSRVLEQEVTIVGDVVSNKVLVSASPRYIQTVERIIAELDAAPSQVMIQVLIAEVTLDDSNEWGLDVNVGRNIDVSNIGGDGYVFDVLGAGTGVATALGVPNFSVLSQDFSLVVRALEVQGKLEVLSRPQVTVNNNERGFILVGEDVAIIDGVERRENTTDVNVVRRNVGIELEVIPSISADGYVRMEINPTISSVSNRTTQLDAGVEAPIIPERRVETVVTVKDGQTIVLGGLIQTTEEERDTKTPLLGDLPLLGGLFRSTDRSNIKTELLVMLTPHVIPGESPWSERRQRDIAKSEIRRLSDPDKVVEAIGSEAARSLRPQEGPPAPWREPDDATEVLQEPVFRPGAYSEDDDDVPATPQREPLFDGDGS